MQAYKIKVANETESKEVQKLLFGLGYAWLINQKEYCTLSEDHFIVTFSDGVILQAPLDHYNTNHEKHQELTLPQLRDLVVLHRNDVSDATHEVIGNNDPLFMTSEGELYYFHVTLNKWQKHGETATDLILSDYARPLKEQIQMTWQDALRAVADGKEVEAKNISWFDAENLKLGQIKQAKEFRLAPQRKELNGNFTKEELLKIAEEMV